MTKEQFIKELEHIAESGSNEIRLGNLFDVVINEAIEDCHERLNDEVKTNERLTEHINKDLFTRSQV